MKDTQSAGYISIEKNNIDLQEIPIRGGKVNAYFTFKNDGNESIALLQGQTSCMCTEAFVESSDGIKSPRIQMPGHGASIAQINQVLDPGENATLTAIFDPMAHGPTGTGPIMRDIYIKTNSKKTPEVKFSFQGNVVDK